MDVISTIQIFIVLFVPYVLLMNYFANYFYEIAQEKGYTDVSIYTICLIFNVVGYLMVCALPDRQGKNINNIALNVLNKQLKMVS